MPDLFAVPPVTTEEHSTILAALRFYQQNLEQAQAGSVSSNQILDIATDGGRHAVLSVDQIENLCQKVNQPEQFGGPLVRIVIDQPRSDCVVLPPLRPGIESTPEKLRTLVLAAWDGFQARGPDTDDAFADYLRIEHDFTQVDEPVMQEITIRAGL